MKPSEPDDVFLYIWFFLLFLVGTLTYIIVLWIFS